MNNKMIITTYLSIITLNVNGLNVLFKRCRVAEWLRKPDSYIWCLQETHFGSKGTQTESKEMEKDISQE